jgi:addiction module HigA family antidote
MMKKRKPVHPGEILREEFMVPLGLSRNRVAMDLRVPVTRIAEIVHEKRANSAGTALRFAHYFNNSPTFWMNFQRRYDLEVAEDEIPDEVERDVRPLKAAPVRSFKTKDELAR